MQPIRVKAYKHALKPAAVFACVEDLKVTACPVVDLQPEDLHPDSAPPFETS